MTEITNLPGAQSRTDDGEISLLDLLVVIAKHKKLIILFPLLVAVITIGYSLSLPNIYTATTKILPPHQSPSTASTLLAQIGSIGGLVGGAVGLKNPNDLYVAMLKSRTVADALIQRFELDRLYDVKYASLARKRLESVSSISAAKDGIITIEVEDKNPKRAAELANAYVDELFKLARLLAVTEASKRRLFFEDQFALAKENLVRAETAARKALQAGGLVKVDDQGRAMVEVTARLRGQITVKEVQIYAMRAFATDHNPDLRLAQKELESMKRELGKIEGDDGSKSTSSTETSRGIDNLGLLRDVKYYEVIFELLARQYELAKIDEAKDSAIIQVLDKAVEPDRKSKPTRSVMVLLWTFAGLFAAILWAFFLEAMARLARDPLQTERLQSLKGYLKWR